MVRDRLALNDEILKCCHCGENICWFGSKHEVLYLLHVLLPDNSTLRVDPTLQTINRPI